jgi:FdrA protein
LVRQVVTRPRIYYDSVTLMRLSSEAQQEDGVHQVSVVMGTEANCAILREAGFDPAAFGGAGPNDLVLAVAAESVASAERALARAADLLAAVGKPTGGEAKQARIRTLQEAQQALEGANVAIISVPGAFAAREAMRALRAGLHVMLFSDNVPLEKEVALKQEAERQGLLVMGPDCGTAVLGGVPLCFANVVRRGPVGMVCASGTGLQEVATLIHRLGSGVSHAIGTGGRDLSAEVGGITMRMGIDLLEQDPATRVIALVSKPPAGSAMERLLERIRRLEKPCVVNFLGADPSQLPAIPGVTYAATLEAAALAALRAAGSGGRLALPAGEEVAAAVREVRGRRTGAAAPPAAAGRFVRGLFCGGTLAQESLLALQQELGGVYSNLAKKPEYRLDDPRRSKGHTVIDMGDDSFTVNRPHPMIDVSYRNQRILQEADSEETGVILVDVVLGYGSHPDPAGALAEAVRGMRRPVPLVASVTGTDEDPQVRERQVAALQEAGVRVMSSNYRAALLAARLVREEAAR